MSSNGDKAGANYGQRVPQIHGICLAFRRGVQRVTAVEITPEAVEAGKRTAHLRILVAICLFASLDFANSLCAGEAMLSLAMVRYGEMKTRIDSGFDSFATAISQRSAAANIAMAQESPRPFPAFRLSNAEQSDSAFTFQLREPPQPLPRNPLVLRKNLANYGHSRTWASVNAGYGQIFKQSARLERWNGAGWEEPSCGYLKVSFSF